MTGASKLLAQTLSKSYSTRRVVDNITMDLNVGEIVGLFGPNGAGKTTTFYMIIGFIKPNGAWTMKILQPSPCSSGQEKE